MGLLPMLIADGLGRHSDHASKIINKPIEIRSTAREAPLTGCARSSPNLRVTAKVDEPFARLRFSTPA
jgi:hypothetical protein